MNKKEKIYILLVLLLISLTHLVMLLLDYNTNDKNLFKINPLSEETIKLNCANLSLKDTAKCLVENIKPIYNYTITDDKINLSFDEIKKIGGDCKDWSELYERIIGDSFYVKQVTMQSTEDNYHKVIIISNDTGYCLLSLKNYKCWDYK